MTGVEPVNLLVANQALSQLSYIPLGKKKYILFPQLVKPPTQKFSAIAHLSPSVIIHLWQICKF